MAPRRGGDGGAGAGVLLPGGRGTFEPPPLKRMQPWLQDGAGQCDLLAGGVDDKGVFQGAYLSGVHLMALLRTFQLSQAFLPVDMPTPVINLGQSLQDGVPIIVVTRGCFGRSMDYGPGPARNDTQQLVWEVCRQMRAEMSQVLITCIDLPINCGADLAQACLSEPLNEYRELMFHDGTWYAPTAIESKSLAKWRADYRQEKTGNVDMKAAKVKFNRKKFGWINEEVFYGNCWHLSWKPVLEVRPATSAPRRSDLLFATEKESKVRAIQGATLSGAGATLQKALAKAREAGDTKALVAGVKAYLARAKPSEKSSLQEAGDAAVEASKRLAQQGDLVESLDAVKLAVDAHIHADEVEKALQVAKDAKNSAANALIEVKAAKLINDCHFALGDSDEALKLAKAIKDEVAKKKTPAALAEATALVVAAHLAMGDWTSAVALAKETSENNEKVVQAKGFALLGEASNAKALQSEESGVDEARRAAAAAFEKARSLYKEQGIKAEEAAALQSAILAHFAVCDAASTSAALNFARDLQGFSTKTSGADKTEMLSFGGNGAEAVAAAHIQEFSRNGTFLEGGREAMLTAAMQAVSLYEQAGDVSRKASAQKVLAEARRTGRD